MQRKIVKKSFFTKTNKFDSKSFSLKISGTKKKDQISEGQECQDLKKSAILQKLDFALSPTSSKNQF